MTTAAGFDPTVGRFLDRHPELEPLVAQVLERAAEVRRAKALAFADEEEPRFPDPRQQDRLQEWDQGLAALEASATEAGGGRAEAEAALGRVLRAAAELRVESHRFRPPRRTVSPERRRALIQALGLFKAAFGLLERRAREAHVRGLPWQIELATAVDPGTAVAAMEITGYELAGVPAVRLPWGERCFLSGALYATDSHARPQPRHRSLERNERVLSPSMFQRLQRLRRALARLEGRWPGLGEPAARLLPELFDAFVEEGCHPTFARLGLLDFPSLAVTLNNLLLRYASRPLFGARQASGGPTEVPASETGPSTPGQAGSYAWQSYADAREQALAFAQGLEALGLAPGARVGVLAAGNRPELYLADFAAIFARLVSVGLHDGLDDPGLLAVMERAGLEAVVVDGPSLRRLAGLELARRCPSLRWAVVFDRQGAPAVDGVGTVDLEELLSPPTAGWVSASGIGPGTPILYGDGPSVERARELGIPRDADQDLYTILFTSGSTGRPKGTPVTRRRWVEEMCVKVDLWPYVGASFQPAAIAADRGSVWRAVANGGRVGFARRGAGLFADLRALRPTLFDVPPVIWNTLYTEYKRGISDPTLTRRQAAAVRQRLRETLGNRLAFISTGGAPSDPGVCRAMEAVFGLPMSEGYGTTETGHIAEKGELLPGLDFELVDRPELGYTREDRPWPRGELAVRTPRTTSRYYGDEESSREGYTEDGYFLTGDLVEVGPGRRIRILGRSKQVFKLAGAELISPEPLERIYGASEKVEAVLITAAPTQSQVVAVVVPAREGLGEDEILGELRAIASGRRMRPCEVPLGVVVAPREGGRLPWSPANGLLTPSYKLNRRALEERYRPQVEGIYAAAEQRREEALEAPESAGGSLEATRQRLVRLVAAILSRSPAEIDLGRSFEEQGGDSLGTMELMLRLEQVFAGKGAAAGPWDADPAQVVAVPLEQVARALAAGAEGGATPELPQTAGSGQQTPPAPAVAASAASTLASPGATTGPEVATRREPESGPGASAEEAVETGGPPSSQELAEMANRDAVAGPRPGRHLPQASGGDLFLTGGTGFLGSHLLHELAAARPGGERIWALVRAADDEAAGHRLAAALEQARLPVPKIGTPVAPGSARVLAVAGSLEGERLGLSEDRWRELVLAVGMVYHVAALVTGRGGYPSSRGPNVVGTRRVLELATTGDLKAFHFVSSLNVPLLAQQVLGGRRVEETTPLPERLGAAILAAQPAYAVTKWASERMVQEAWASSGGAFRASVSRPALLTWSTATGKGNEEDWLPRVLASCLEMGAALGPEVAGIPCWAAETETSARGLDMVPVDFAARAVARLGEATRQGELPQPPAGPWGMAPTFHVSNLSPGEAGLVTFPRLMDLLVAADLRLRVDGAAMGYLPKRDWLLEAEIQGASALPILDQLAGLQPALPRTPAARFAAAMAGEPCPGIDLEAVTTYVRRWRENRRGGE